MIRLAAASWNLEVPAALRKLVDARVGMSEAAVSPAVIRDYVRDYVKYPDRIVKFWGAAQTEHLKAATGDLRELQRKFNSHNAGEDWKEKGGRFLGSTRKMAVDRLLHPGRVSAWEERKEGGYSSKIFKGHGWGDLLAMPFYDLPGRICGFLFVGRKGERQDYVYRNTISLPTNEAGLGMLDSLMFGRDSRLGRTGFVMTDVDLALRLQMRHLVDRRRPLPLVVSWRDQTYETRAIWDWLGHEDLVFCGIREPLEAIRQARLANAKVADIEVSHAELAANMRHRSPAEWLDRMKTAAAPWAIVLRRMLRDMPAADVEDALLEVELTGRELYNFIKGSDPELRGRLEHIERNRVFQNRVRFEKKWFFEKSDGWYLEKGEDCICNAVVRVEQVLTTAAGKSYYRGVVKFEGKNYPFTERVETLEKGALNWAQSFVRDVHGAGVIEYYPSWNRKSLQLAIAFHKPDLASGVEIIGWDDKDRQFNFPKFSICRGGRVATDCTCLFDNDRVPAREAPVPGSIARKHIEQLGERHDETLVFWGTAAAVAANLLAPAMNREPSGLLLDGEGAQAVGAAAAFRLGCPEIDVPRNTHPVDAIVQQTDPHRWPAVLTGQYRLDKWVDDPATKNVLAAFPWATNSVLASRGRWNMLRCDRKLGSMQLVQHAAPYVLPNYLQDVYQRGIMITDDHPDLILNVLDDMAGWFQTIGGNRDAVESAKSLLLVPGKDAPWQHFLHLIFRLHNDGALRFARASHDDSKRKASAIIQVDGEPSKVWISQNMFSDAVRAEGSLQPDLLLVTKSLDEAGVLVGEASCREEPGWVVQEKWWNHPTRRRTLPHGVPRRLHRSRRRPRSRG